MGRELGSPGGKTLHYPEEQDRVLRRGGPFFGSGVTALYEDSRGATCRGGNDEQVYGNGSRGPPKVYPMPEYGQPGQCIDRDRRRRDPGDQGHRNREAEERQDGDGSASAGLEFQPGELLRDRHGALWIGAMVDSGLLHLHEGRSDLFTRSDGLSGNTVPALLEDREGSIWVATVDGVDRFRDVAVPRISTQQGLSSNAVLSLVATKDGSIWLGTDTGLNRWRRER